MKKKFLTGAVLAATLAFLAACGGSNAAGGADAGTTDAPSAAESVQQATDPEQPQESQETGNVLKGYLFVQKGVSISVDTDMEPVLAALGEPVSYFESASCAFEGLDKIYTYSDFEIDTYPQGDKDMISAILLKSDIVTTAEGVYVGASFADVTNAYGTDYAEEKGMVVYQKDGMKLCFIVQNDEVTSIQYLSTVLDE